MKKKLLFLNALLILNTLSLVSCANDKFYNVNKQYNKFGKMKVNLMYKLKRLFDKKTIKK